MNSQTVRWVVVSTAMTALFVHPLFAQLQARNVQADQPMGAMLRDIMPYSFTVYQMLGDGSPAAGSLPAAITSGRIFSTAESRKAAGAKMIPAINRMLAIYSERASALPAQMRDNNTQEVTLLNIVKVALGDVQAGTNYQKAADGDGPDAAMAAVVLAAADYLASGRDAAGQRAAITRLEEAYKKIGADAPLQEVPMIFSKNPPAPEAMDQALAFLRADTHSKFSQWVAMNFDIRLRAAAILNKPLTIEGKLINGSEFSTAAWKGKVILVDFWGPACVPCVQEMPTIERIYSAQRGRGLEVLGFIGSGEDTVKSFLGKNPAMTWPQMLSLTHPSHDPGGDFGLDGLPTTLLIDRKGILRISHSGADENLGEEIGRLLDETP